MRIDPCAARRGFTLIELLVVITIIIVLVGLILSTSGYVQKKGARSRAEAEIAALSAALESYKVDSGIYPRDATTTDVLDAKVKGDPSTYKTASLYLFTQLSGTDQSLTPIAGARTYFTFKPQMLDGTKDANGNITTVSNLRDPFGNSYGYSTAYVTDAEVQNAKTPPGTVTKGYNPTFDLWSTSGTVDTSATPSSTQWIKNW